MRDKDDIENIKIKSFNSTYFSFIENDVALMRKRFHLTV
ncbi:unknown [[Mannheimia] succiniciproducens MBEL55E]|uniref:Uncharacterized protein n=1 Tax=Mannheimia succiniciproducens (strain KCTC 0769BP / MBEL55E) TaxID=221988 RepID=Q65V03_MANSM|nr:unknown [[Mannheimia] succiniciproducens MBEL55E]